MKQRKTWLAVACATLVPGLAAAQSGYSQSGPAENPNETLTVSAVSPAMSIPVKTSVSQPVMGVEFAGYRDMVCAPRRPKEEVYGSQRFPVDSEAGGSLRLKERLLERLAALDAASMRKVLQDVAKRTDRAAQFQSLFGVALPPSSGTFDAPYGDGSKKGESWAVRLNDAQRLQLNTGQPQAARIVSDPDTGTGNYAAAQECLSLPQVDAAIATAKGVYEQVIAALEGKSTAASKATLQPSSGLQTQTGTKKP